MAPKKDLTPKQLSNSLSYVQKEAPFLARMRGKTIEKEKQARKFEDYQDGQDDDDYDELEGAQIVALDDRGKEIHVDAGEKSDPEEKVEEQLAMDENGRILFRKSTKKSSLSKNTKRKLQSIIEKEIQDGPEKKKKKTKTPSLLSFGGDDDE